MSRKRQRKSEKHRTTAASPAKLPEPGQPSVQASKWPLDVSHLLTAGAVVLITLCTAMIYGQTVHVAPIDYDDHFN
jgi:hypothetical protein